MNLLHFLMNHPTSNLHQSSPAGGASPAKPAGIPYDSDKARFRHMSRLNIAASGIRKRMRVTSGMLEVFGWNGGAK